MSKGTKKQYKQFEINSLEDALLVLSSLIVPVTIDLDKFKTYTGEAKELLSKYTPGSMIPAKEYDDVHDKSLYRQRELLKYVADHQDVSFSYISLRRILEKKNYLSRKIEPDKKEILNDLLNIRNWSFHNVQSMLVANRELAMKSIPTEILGMVEVKPQLNPVIIRKYKSYPWNHLESFIQHNIIRTTQFETILEEMKKDYQLMYTSISNGQFTMIAGELHQDVQFIDYEIAFDPHGIDSRIATLSMDIQKGMYNCSEESHKK